MKFLVMLSCATHVQCGLPAPQHHEVEATSVHDCYKTVEMLIKRFGQEPSNFRFKCEPKG